MNFKKIQQKLKKDAKDGKIITDKSRISFQVFALKGLQPMTVLLSIHGKPTAKMVFDAKNVKFYFQKPDIPYEIDYTSFEFKLTENIEALLSSVIVAMYPTARTVHDCLLDAFNEEEEA